MQVNWFYYNSTQALSLSQVQSTVGTLYKNGTSYLNTSRSSAAPGGTQAAS